MNRFKRLLLKLIFPEIHNTLELELPVNLSAHDQLWVARREYLVIAKEFDAQTAEMAKVCDQRDLCLNSLMSLVALDDDNQWTTVFEADTRLPAEISDYLTALVARA